MRLRNWLIYKQNVEDAASFLPGNSKVRGER